LSDPQNQHSVAGYGRRESVGEGTPIGMRPQSAPPVPAAASEILSIPPPPRPRSHPGRSGVLLTRRAPRASLAMLFGDLPAADIFIVIQ